ncbi:ferredoxin reductase [Salipiger sp. IMCC34102]|uniref:NAD(P)/FAD-dependent oxidoreductase n=1 Tax=Salipiger sp. IMCC34102 TaxID=2510647 RepID=UPI00101C04BF|nr:FAD-dependent oxidoreductase [Salipiger sp. IMCC34102]RYH02108.1 ferredoxin reductase [Salipiger sp. IMCC34102]
MPGIVIIGAGECGIRAALTAREAGYDGPITVLGDEAALPYERPLLSKPNSGGVVEKLIATREALDDMSITLETDVSVTAIDRDERMVVRAQGDPLPFRKLLLATGARARRLSCPGGDRARVLRTMEDARAIYSAAGTARSAVIVGAGLIGLELAAELTGRGLGVTVLEAGPRPLGRNVPERLASKLTTRHQQAGVEVLCGVQVASCTESDVVLEDGRAIAADLIVAAIGVEPNVELAVSAGLTIQNGIRVDRRLVTDDPDILAAGDCAAVEMRSGLHLRYETWQNAQAQGEVAGRNLAGGNKEFDVPVWFWSDHYEIGLQGVGDTSGQPAASREMGRDSEILFFLNDAGALIGAAGLGQGSAVAKDIKIAQRLIGTTLDPVLLSDPAHNLKKLLRAA